MATRKQERRWFRVADSVTRERWSNDELALFVRLLGHLNARRMRDDLDPEDAVRVYLGPAELAHLAGCQSLVRARRTLGGLAVNLGLTWSARGADTSVTWPKVAEMQGWRCPRTAPEMPTPYPTPTPTPDLPSEDPSYPASRARPKARREARRTPAPEALEPADLERLRAWAAAKHPAVAARVPALVEACLTFHRAKGSLMACWYAAAQTWIRNEAEGRFGRVGPSPGGSGGFASRPEPGGRAYRPFTPERRDGVAVVSLLGDLRKAVRP